MKHIRIILNFPDELVTLPYVGRLDIDDEWVTVTQENGAVHGFKTSFVAAYHCE